MKINIKLSLIIIIVALIGSMTISTGMDYTIKSISNSNSTDCRYDPSDTYRSITANIIDIYDSDDKKYIILDNDNNNQYNINYASKMCIIVNNHTIFHSKDGQKQSIDVLSPNDQIRVHYSPIETLSIPPKSIAYEIILIKAGIQQDQNQFDHPEYIPKC
jgi:hypothetical protein